MRIRLIPLPLLLCAAPAFAQPAPEPQLQLPPELTDPATTDKLANAAQALSQAVLDVPVGSVKAAIEGRQPSASERRMTVRDFARRQDPDFDRHLQQQIANARPMVQQSMKALTDALPSMLAGLSQAQKSLERAMANMPDPTYPKR